MMPRIRKLYNRSYMSLNPNDAGKTIIAAAKRFQTHAKLIDVRVVHFGRQLAIGHKTIFAAFSSYFESLLKDVEGIAVLNVDSIDATHVRHIGTIVDFMYGRTISVSCAGEARELLDAARIFGVSSLCKCFPESNNCKTTTVINPTAASSLLLISLQRYRKEMLFIDVKVQLSGIDEYETFSCHKLVLSAFSCHLESILESDDSELIGMDCIEDVYIRQMKYIFDFMYGMRVKLDDRQVPIFIEAARIFAIDSLQSGELAKIREKALKMQHERIVTERIVRLRGSGSRSIGADVEPVVVDRQLIRNAWQTLKKAKPNDQTTLVEDASRSDTQICIDDTEHDEIDRTASSTHSCPLCSREFRYRSRLKKHLQLVHMKSKPYGCTMCDYSAAEKSALSMHIRYKHTNERPFVCSTVGCEMQFASVSALTRHRRSKHHTMPLHRCTLCKKQFNEKRELVVHMDRDHYDRRAYNCTHCNAAFYRKDHLLVHTRKLHSTTTTTTNMIV